MDGGLKGRRYELLDWVVGRVVFSIIKNSTILDFTPLTDIQVNEYTL